MAKHPITVRLPDKLHKALRKELSDHAGLSLSKYIQAILTRHVYEASFEQGAEDYETLYKHFAPWLLEIENEE